VCLFVFIKIIYFLGGLYMYLEKKKGLAKMATVLISSFVLLAGCSSSDTSSSENSNSQGKDKKESVELLNVSYDPTRELYEYEEYLLTCLTNIRSLKKRQT